MWKKIICYLLWLSNTFTAATLQLAVKKKKPQQKPTKQKNLPNPTPFKKIH